MNKKLNKNSIYLKYNFCNNIQKLAVSIIIIIIFKKLFFILQVFVKLIETLEINIVRKHLYFE